MQNKFRVMETYNYEKGYDISSAHKLDSVHC